MVLLSGNPYWEVAKPLDGAVYNGVLNPRRGVINPLPGAPSWGAYRKVMSAMFERYGLQAYTSNASGEMSFRPAPQVTSDDAAAKLRAAKDLYSVWGPKLLAKMAKELEPPWQTYNKESRVGWPEFQRSEEKAKLAEHYFQTLVERPSSFDQCFTIQNVRIQPEPASKERDVQVVFSDGSGEAVHVDAAAREITGPDGSVYLAQRARPVNNLPIPNLWCQIVDTAMNNVIGSWGFKKFDMYGAPPHSRIRRHYRAVDVKHMERFTAAIMPLRTTLIGGSYAMAHNKMEAGGYVVPSADDWGRVPVLLRRPKGTAAFASGHSAVAPSQAEFLFCILWALHVVIFGMEEEAAFEAVKTGETPYLSIFNFGDDNFWSSSEEAYLEQALGFTGSLLDIQDEDPPKFLGFIYNTKTGRFFLSHESYLLKTYLHERSPLGLLRKKPFLGWTLKREIYSQYGDRDFMRELYLIENAELAKVGMSWSDVERKAREEKDELSAIGPLATPEELFGKDYLLTAEQKMALGTYDGLSPSETAAPLRDMIAGGILDV